MDIFGGKSSTASSRSDAYKRATNSQIDKARYTKGVSGLSHMTVTGLRQVMGTAIRGQGGKALPPDELRKQWRVIAGKAGTTGITGEKFKKMLREDPKFKDYKFSPEARDKIARVVFTQSGAVDAPVDNALSPEDIKRMSRASRALGNVGTSNRFALRGEKKRLGSERAEQIKGAKTDPLKGVLTEQSGYKVSFGRLGVQGVAGAAHAGAEQTHAASAVGVAGGAAHAGGNVETSTSVTQALGKPASKIGAGVGTDSRATGLERKPGVVAGGSKSQLPPAASLLPS